MKLSILTLFPEMFIGPFDHSIIKIARQKKLADIDFINIRDFGIGKHKVVDDTPYGGGIGMVMRVDVLLSAIEFAKKSYTSIAGENIHRKIILLSASGKTFNQQKAKDFSALDHLIIICGHYEGIDARIGKFIDEEISIGDFVTTGGEIPAMLIADSIIRLLPGVLKPGATENESFSLKSEKGNPVLEYPHFTKPQSFKDLNVPEILLSGNHAKIETWRREQAVLKTKKNRPDL